MKLLILNSPIIEIHRPPIGISIIANTCERNGHDVTVIDLNIEFYKTFDNSNDFYNFDSIFDGIIPIDQKNSDVMDNFIKNIIPDLTDYDHVLISVFSSKSIMFTEKLCEYIRHVSPDKQIILGGQGVGNHSLFSDGSFGQQMIKSKLCDYYISGDGEVAVIELLNGNTGYTGINSDFSSQLLKLDDMAIPNYKYYNLDDYDYLSDREVSIVGSRGCVRNCTYCDVSRYWPKFSYRSGKHIADEMRHNYETFGIQRFYFTDSLINGSIKAFNEMCNELVKHDLSKQIKWGGQLIFRPERQTPPEYFQMMAEAGGDEFYVGVETGSDKIRWEMDKKFTNDDIEYNLENFAKNNLKTFFLMLIGYVTETPQDHQDTLKMFKRWQKYVATGTITGIDLGKFLEINVGTPLETMIDEYQVEFLIDNNLFWEAGINPELTITERLRRRLETHQEAIKYKWPIWRGENRLSHLKTIAETNHTLKKPQ